MKLTEIKDVSFKESNLWGVRFDEASIDNVNFSSSRIADARFIDLDLLSSDLSDTLAFGAVFERVNLLQKDCDYLKSEEAKFKDADCQ